MSLVSVILPVYNGSPYLRATLTSILSQSFKDFELIIINDGSTDDSELVIKDFNDSRIHYTYQQNQGLPATLNKAIGLARGEFIARQDQDDISFPLRLQKQIEFLTANADVGMVGTNAEIWANDIKTERLLEHPSDDASIKFNLLFNNPFVHSSVMIRRTVFEKVGVYCVDKFRQPPEDYELWSRVAKEFKVANLPEVLLAYREVAGSMSRTGLNPFLNHLIVISAENIAWYTGRETSSPEVMAIAKLAQGVYADIPRGVSSVQIENAVRNAANAIIVESKVASNHLDLLVKTRLAMLQYHYFQHRTGGWSGWLLSGSLGRYAKNFAKRIVGR